MQKASTIRPFLLTVFGVLLGFGIVAGFGGIDKLNLAFGAGGDVKLGGPMPSLPANANLESMNLSFRAISKAVQPVVVAINVKTEAPKRSNNGGSSQNPFHFFFNNPGDGGDEEGGGFDMSPFGDQGPSEGLGSGVVITSDGYILTNNHVVENAAKKGGVTVKFSDRKVYEATVVGTDPTTDLAVIKVEATGLTAAALGSSDDVEVGDWVIAVGNPLGLESTVTKGIVSSMGRSLGIVDRQKTGGYSIENFIQTDAAINPGNSGGGLFNIRGQVIGINAAIATKTGMFAGYGFAIPINMARTVAMDLIKFGKVNRGYIGVQIRSIDATEAEALGMGAPRGVRVDGVVPKGAGEAAGLIKNDIILSVDGKETNESQELQGIIGMHHAGDNVGLKIWRDGREIEKVVKLKAREEKGDIGMVSGTVKSDQDEDGVDTKKETASLDNIGLSVRNLTSSEKDKFDVDGGVVITKVAMASEAYDRGLSLYAQGPASLYGNGRKSPATVGVITHVARNPVRNVGDFEKAISMNKGKAVGLTVKDNQGDSRYIALRVPRD